MSNAPTLWNPAISLPAKISASISISMVGARPKTRMVIKSGSALDRESESLIDG